MELRLPNCSFAIIIVCTYLFLAYKCSEKMNKEMRNVKAYQYDPRSEWVYTYLEIYTMSKGNFKVNTSLR